MIQEGKLTYGATPSSLRDWEFENAVLNTFVIAVLTTVLSYQAASLAFDLFLGFKAENETRISDMHILLLTRRSSPLAVCASFLRCDWLTRIQFKGDLLEEGNIERDTKNPVRFSVVGKLLLLLALVPILNVVSIVLNFTRVQTISFGEARFGGAYLDVNEDLSVIEVEPFTGSCDTAVIESARIDRPNVTFITCHRFTFFPENESLAEGASVLLSRQLLTTALLKVAVGRYEGYAMKSADVSINESNPFHLRSTISPRTAQRLVDFGISILVQKCSSERPNVYQIPNTFVSEQPETDLQVGKFISCPSFSEDESTLRDQLLTQLLNSITLVDADVLELIHPESFKYVHNESFDTSDIELFRGDDYPFLIRTEPYVSLPMLAVITAVVLAVRVISNLFLNNDIAEGVHRLVKKALGFLCWQSLLRTDDVEPYYKNYDHNVC